MKNPIEFGIDQDKIIRLAIVGDLSEDKLEPLSVSMYEFRKAVESLYRQ